jgi:hypothetical protein
MMRRTLTIAISALAIALATALPADAKLKNKVFRYTVGASVVSAFSEMCGAKRIGKFQESFIVFAGTKQKLSDKDKTDIRALFARAKKDAYERIPAGAARKSNAQYSRMQNVKKR